LTENKAMTTAATNRVVADRTYGYNNAGSITSINDHPDAQPADNQCFSYNYAQELTQAWTPTGAATCASTPTAATTGGAAPYWQNYTYDTTGDRTGLVQHSLTGSTDKTATYTYPTPGAAAVRPHAVSTVVHTGGSTGTDSYGYDASGDTTTRPGQTLTWDSEGRLATTTVTASAQVQSDIYDAEGNLLIRSNPAGSTLYWGDLEITSTAAGLSGIRTYSALGAARAVRTTTAGVTGTVGTWLDADPQGTAELTMSPATGAVTRRHFDPFGNQRDASVVAWPDSHGFLNKPIDGFAGTTHLGDRDYDSITGRFLSVDPLLNAADPLQANGYSYASNSPINLSDPSGDRPVDSNGDDFAPAPPGKRTTHNPSAQPVAQNPDQWAGNDACRWGCAPPAPKKATAKPKPKKKSIFRRVAKTVPKSVVNASSGAARATQDFVGSVIPIYRDADMGIQNPVDDWLNKHGDKDSGAYKSGYWTLQGVFVVGLAVTDDEGAAAAETGVSGTRLATIGGPKEFDPSVLRGMSSGDVRGSIPSDWVPGSSKSGGGEVFRDPANSGRQIRIMPGYPAGSRPDLITTGPYAVVSQHGVTTKVPLLGNPTLP
ncbi:MAG: secreted protein, partial [Frankiales bacterium]|nr:secreted protein [Frankiales bacterium]